jgi:tetratricopeptide (TPR) repeat protein
MRLVPILFVLLAGPALAVPRGQHPPQPKPVDALFQALKQATSPEDAKPIEDQIGLFFMQSGSPSIDLLMARATAALAGGDKNSSRKIFDAVTKIAPNFAEGWHSRAALQIAANDNEGAMLSLQRTINLNPRQFRALSELADMLEDFGDKAGALKLYRRALALDPKLEGIDRHVKVLEDAVEGQKI